MSAALEAHDSGWSSGFERDRLMSVSEWADTYRELSSLSSAQRGRWRTMKTPYLREIMDALSPRNPCRRVVFMKGSQVGGTETGNNWIGHMIHRSPGPMLVVLPTVDIAKKVSKQRIAPMIEATPVLRERVRDPRSRDSGNTVQVKEFPGGVLMMVGANSAAGLRSMPVRDLFCDEIDEYPRDLDGQGDPIALAEKRTSNFPNRKALHVSTPTIKGISRIETEYLASDQRRYYIPCPNCGYMDYLTWNGRDWLGSAGGSHHRIEWDDQQPQTARMVCGNPELDAEGKPACGARIAEKFKDAMLRHGEWRATVAGGDGRTIGYHLSSLYSPYGWKSWEDCVDEFLKAKNDPPKLKTWVNTVLGETWEERGDSVEPETLRARDEKAQENIIPIGVGVVIASVDVQGDRLEVLVKGYGAGEESWTVSFGQIHGDPASMAVWNELDRYLKQEFVHENGRRLKIDAVTIDSGGLHTEAVYQYVKSRARGSAVWTRDAQGNIVPRSDSFEGLRIFAVKGGSESGRPLVMRPSYGNSYRLPLFVLCVDTGKDIVMSRLSIRAPGPGFMHIPEWIDDEYLEQLTAERALRKYVKGRGLARVWVKTRDRNEALDLEVYALAGLYILGQPFIKALGERAARFAKPLEPGAAPEPDEISTPRNPGKTFPQRPRQGWVDKWRG